MPLEQELLERQLLVMGLQKQLEPLLGHLCLEWGQLLGMERVEMGLVGKEAVERQLVERVLVEKELQEMDLWRLGAEQWLGDELLVHLQLAHLMD
jgi:hypothetical protein